MAISEFDQSVVALRHALRNLLNIVRKAEAHADAEGIEPEALLHARLYPDMRDFVFQVQVATDVARRGVARLAGTEAPSWPDDEQSFAELGRRIENAIAYLGEFEPEQLEGAGQREIALELRDQTHEMSGQDYLLHFILPNVYFHASTAYALMRHNGVKLGKRDFIGSFSPER